MSGIEILSRGRALQLVQGAPQCACERAEIARGIRVADQADADAPVVTQERDSDRLLGRERDQGEAPLHPFPQ